MSSMDQHLKDLFDAALRPLPFLTRRPMFGCDAFFAKANIFGLVWDGRVVLKLPDKKRFAEALAMPGAVPWKPMPAAKNPMAHWVVMGEALHDDAELFAQWVAQAHRLALEPSVSASAPPKTVVERREVVFRPPTPTPPWKKALEKKRAAEAKKTAPKKKPTLKKKPPGKKQTKKR